MINIENYHSLFVHEWYYDFWSRFSLPHSVSVEFRVTSCAHVGLFI